jgi:hypothetical protein
MGIAALHPSCALEIEALERYHGFGSFGMTKPPTTTVGVMRTVTPHSSQGCRSTRLPLNKAAAQQGCRQTVLVRFRFKMSNSHGAKSSNSVIASRQRCSTKTVIPRACGGSSTPRLLGSTTGASGILGRPVKPGDDDREDSRFLSRHTFAFPRLDSPGLCQSFRPKEGVGNAGCPVHPQPRVRKWWLECTRVFTASSPETPGIPARNGFTAYTALSLVTGLSCHHHRRITPPT